MTYTQLTLGIRYQISCYLEEEYSISAIAQLVGYNRSTIHREIKRNSLNGEYDAEYADQLALARKQIARKHIVIDSILESAIESLLELKFSPEQISKLLSKTPASVSYQSIYNFIHSPLENRSHLAKLLPFYRARGRNGRKKYIEHIDKDNRLSIELRPLAAELRTRYGDLEIDTIVGKDRKSGVLTVVDRRSRFTWARLIEDHKAETIEKTLLDILLPIKDRIHTITSDNGVEFSNWKSISKQLGCKFYFCHPYSSWERGTVENTNGLIRRFYPKGTDFTKVVEEDLQFAVNLINIRPRKSLNFKTTYEKFFKTESFWDTTDVLQLLLESRCFT